MQKRVENKQLKGFLDFKDKSDEEIVAKAKSGNSRAQEYLISKYENFVKSKAKSYFFNWSRQGRHLSRRDDRFI